MYMMNYVFKSRYCFDSRGFIVVVVLRRLTVLFEVLHPSLTCSNVLLGLKCLFEMYWGFSQESSYSAGKCKASAAKKQQKFECNI